jgi:ribosomal protein L30E
MASTDSLLNSFSAEAYARDGVRLPQNIQVAMEQYFAADLSDVRIHTGPGQSAGVGRAIGQQHGEAPIVLTVDGQTANVVTIGVR